MNLQLRLTIIYLVLCVIAGATVATTILVGKIYAHLRQNKKDNERTEDN
jgi:hypothetical protein